jgi:hypothetical protein
MRKTAHVGKSCVTEARVCEATCVSKAGMTKSASVRETTCMSKAGMTKSARMCEATCMGKAGTAGPTHSPCEH